MENDDYKYLPIGSVVLLNGGIKKVMIIGYKAKTTSASNVGNEELVWDYSGCIYPEGLFSSDRILLFNHSQINKLFYTGFQDEEQIEFMKKL